MMNAKRFPNGRRTLVIALALAGVTLLGTVATGPAQAQPAPNTATDLAATSAHAERSLCPPTSKRVFRCMARLKPRTSTASTMHLAAAKVLGLTPADIRAAYNLPAKGGKGQTIAIVDAYDHPKVEADLAVYRKTFKLGACTTANRCFRKVNQRGHSKVPAPDAGWAGEIALDVQAVSAVCPSCKILLVEADSAEGDSLGAAVNTAVRLGATVVSNSYGGPETNGIARDGKKYYTHPGVPQVVSSGDNGFQDSEFPAALAQVWAIGATYLEKTKSGYQETAAYFSGSNCSAWIAKPSYQKDTHCPGRTVADISAAGDGPNGFAVYDTYGLGANGGWIGMAGTSLSAPLVAAMIGLAGNPAKASQPSYAYAHRSGLKDVVGGNNSYIEDCGGDYLCNALKGYDAPTGLGSPRGLKSL
jgi:subtilase family serine protease